MLVSIKSQLQQVLEASLSDVFSSDTQQPPTLELETPGDKKHGDLATNVAMRSAKLLKKKPVDIAEELIPVFDAAIEKSKLKGKIEKIDIKGPGFINFTFTSDALVEVVETIFKEGDKYGQSDLGKKEKIQIEFVSANPTGPLSVAHARQAAVGDALGNVLDALGFKVTKEYYVNDEGNQINILGQSIQLRAQEILGESIEFPEDCYQGDYVKEITQLFLDQKKIKDTAGLSKVKDEDFNNFGVDYLMNVIKTDLKDFGVNFDVWAHQSKIATLKNIEKQVKDLQKIDLVYEHEGALWFKSTQFGDDKDRVLKKSDGSYTYLTPDIVYHKDKFDRGFSRLFNIWGPDHHGYIPRIKASAEALGKNKDDLEVLIVQLATIYRDGQPVSMSTRRGQFISLREVIDEVGVDASRYFFLMRHIKAHLDFDLELAKKESPENPVYYIQYAHARIHSIHAKAKEAKVKLKKKGFSLLKEEAELDLLKALGSFPEALIFCYKQLDPYPLVSYMHELATTFHRFYDKHKVVDENKDLSEERLALCDATRIVLANGLKLLGVSTPESM